MAVGIEDNIGTIKSAVKDMTAASMFEAPTPDFNNWNVKLRSLNSQARTSFGGSYEQEINVSQQPAYINLSLGGTEFTAFVDDISREQGKDAQFKRSFKF